MKAHIHSLQVQPAEAAELARILARRDEYFGRTSTATSRPPHIAPVGCGCSRTCERLLLTGLPSGIELLKAPYGGTGLLVIALYTGHDGPRFAPNIVELTMADRLAIGSFGDATSRLLRLLESRTPALVS